MEVIFCFLTDGKQHKARELDMITRDHDMIIVQSAEMTSQALTSKIHCTLSANQKRASKFNV